MSTNNLTISDSQLRQILRNAVMGTFIRKISHLNNNIVTGIHGYTSLALANYQHPEKVKKFLTDAGTCCNNLMQRNMDVLSLFPKKNPKEITHTTAALSSLSSFYNNYMNRELIIQIEELPEAALNIPENDFKEILIFLLTRSSKQLQCRGRINLRTADTYHPYTFSLRIQPERIGKPYSQFSSTLEEPDEDLSQLYVDMARVILTASGGTFEENSLQPSLTEYTLHFPLVKSRNEKPDFASLPPDTPHTARRKVLLLRIRKYRNIVKIYLFENGYEVLTFETGEKVCHAIKSGDYQTVDLYLLDVYLPDMSGIDVAKFIRQHHPDSRILFCSALSDRCTVEDHMRLNSKTMLINKPFTKNEILQVINTIMKR